MQDLNLKRWHIAKAKGHLFDASIRRSFPKSWQHYMDLAKWERKLAAKYKGN